MVAENRCSTYDADDYSYPQSLEDYIIAELGALWSRYDVTLNRQVKAGKDAAEWLRPANGCWFANGVLRVRQAWNLMAYRREGDALDDILAGGMSPTLQQPWRSTLQTRSGRRRCHCN